MAKYTAPTNVTNYCLVKLHRIRDSPFYLIRPHANWLHAVLIIMRGENAKVSTDQINWLECCN